MGILSDMVNDYRAATTFEQRVAAVEKIIYEIGSELLRFACQNLNREIAEEIYQETLLVISLNLGKYKGDSDNTFRSWCFRILRNKIANFLKEKKFEDVVEFNDESMREAIDAGTKEISPDVRHDLEYAMNLLGARNSDCRPVMLLHHIEGWEIKEIAAYQRKYDAVRIQLGPLFGTGRVFNGKTRLTDGAQTEKRKRKAGATGRTSSTRLEEAISGQRGRPEQSA